MTNLIYAALASQLDETEKNALRIDLNSGTYEQIEHLMLSKLIGNLDLKQLYADCANEHLSSCNVCTKCKFYKSDIQACIHPTMEQEYGTPFYIPANIKFSCELISPLRSPHE